MVLGSRQGIVLQPYEHQYKSWRAALIHDTSLTSYHQAPCFWRELSDTTIRILLIQRHAESLVSWLLPNMPTIAVDKSELFKALGRE